MESRIFTGGRSESCPTAGRRSELVRRNLLCCILYGNYTGRITGSYHFQIEEMNSSIYMRAAPVAAASFLYLQKDR
jgi:hypothetical protein